MFPLLLSAVTAASMALAAPAPVSPLVDRAAVDNTQPVGTNPISVASVQRLGYQTASNSCSHRDLGFAGKIAGTWYSVFGDTLWCQGGVTDPNADSDGFHGMVRDSVSRLTNDPLKVIDLNLNSDTPVPHQQQFVPYNSAWGETNSFGFGGTSLVETNATSATGAVFYLVNANDAGIRGAGVGKVQVINGTPTVTQRFGNNGYWWDSKTTARYGDIAAYRDEKSPYIYALGGSPTSVTDWVGSAYVYMTRVRAADAYDVTKYQYWWGRQQGWKSNVLTTFTSETAVMWGAGQGQLLWSPFYSCYIYVNLGSSAAGPVYLRTAPSPEGPWTADIKVYQATPINGGLVYGGVAHPYLDNTGQTLVISYTNNNHIEVIKVAFKK